MITLYFYTANAHPCVKYCCHVWIGAPILYLDMLHPWLIVDIYYFSKFSYELSGLVPLPYSCGWSICYSTRFLEFLVTNSGCYHNVYVKNVCNSGIPCLQCFPLTWDLNDLKSRVNKHLFFVGFLKTFLYPFHLFLLFFLVITCLVVAVTTCQG